MAHPTYLPRAFQPAEDGMSTMTQVAVYPGELALENHVVDRS